MQRIVAFVYLAVCLFAIPAMAQTLVPRNSDYYWDNDFTPGEVSLRLDGFSQNYAGYAGMVDDSGTHPWYTGTPTYYSAPTLSKFSIYNQNHKTPPTAKITGYVDSMSTIALDSSYRYAGASVKHKWEAMNTEPYGSFSYRLDTVGKAKGEISYKNNTSSWQKIKIAFTVSFPKASIGGVSLDTWGATSYCDYEVFENNDGSGSICDGTMTFKVDEGGYPWPYVQFYGYRHNAYGPMPYDPVNNDWSSYQTSAWTGTKNAVLYVPAYCYFKANTSVKLPSEITNETTTIPSNSWRTATSSVSVVEVTAVSESSVPECWGGGASTPNPNTSEP